MTYKSWISIPTDSEVVPEATTPVSGVQSELSLYQGENLLGGRRGHVHRRAVSALPWTLYSCLLTDLFLHLYMRENPSWNFN